jgi:hypothetical protein
MFRENAAIRTAEAQIDAAFESFDETLGHDQLLALTNATANLMDVIMAEAQKISTFYIIFPKEFHDRIRPSH